MEIKAHNNQYTVNFNVSDAFEVIDRGNIYIVMRNGYNGVELFKPEEFLSPLVSAIGNEYKYEILIDQDRTSTIVLAFQLNIYDNTGQ